MARLERAFGCTATCLALALAACAGESGGGDALRSDEAPPCSDGRHRLADGFDLDREVDYIGDHDNGTVISSMGTPCEGARHPERCTLAFDAAVESHRTERVLITIVGDDVRVWVGTGVLGLFGGIDTPAEAVYFATMTGYTFDCNSTVTRESNGYRLTVLGAGFECDGTPIPLPGDLVVTKDAALIAESVETEPCRDRF